MAGEPGELSTAPVELGELINQIIRRGFLVTLRLDLENLELVYVTVGLKDKGATFHGTFKQCILWCSDWCAAVV